VYYDLLNYREANAQKNAAIIRLEQLYPLHAEAMREIVGQFSSDAKIVWCQEESQNMGAWNYIYLLLERMFHRPVWYAGRNASSSPAVGALAVHKTEQNGLVEDAFKLG
jgi:2-oxoglutarate dehydrogenase E1 component